MKQGDKVRDKTTGFTGTITGDEQRMIDGVQTVTRVLITAEKPPGSMVNPPHRWIDAGDVEQLEAGQGDNGQANGEKRAEDTANATRYGDGGPVPDARDATRLPTADPDVPTLQR